MATPVQTATAPTWSWRQPSAFLRRAPRALVWTIILALAWAIIRPPLTLLAGMVRWQPTGSEHLYLVGMGVGLVLDLLLYGFLLAFLVGRRERWAQGALVAVSLVQAAYWGAKLLASNGAPVLVAPNFPFGTPPPIPRDAMYAVSMALPLVTAIVAMLPGVWRWTRRERRAEQASATTA